MCVCVCVDFSDVGFCGAAGISVLFGAVRALGTRGRIVIYDPSPSAAKVIGLAGLDRVVDVAASRAVTAPPTAGPDSIDDTSGRPRHSNAMHDRRSRTSASIVTAGFARGNTFPSMDHEDR